MDDILDEVVRITRRCERAARLFESEPVKSSYESLMKVAAEFDALSSRSWLGYHAFVYTDGFARPRPGMIFNPQWGLRESYGRGTIGPWRTYEYEEVADEIKYRAGVEDLAPLTKASNSAREIFDGCKIELIPLFDAIIEHTNDPVIRSLREKAEKVPSHVSATEFAKSEQPRSFLSSDTLAYSQGVNVPHHLSFTYWLAEKYSYATQAGELAEVGRHAQKYLSARLKMKGKTVAKTEGKIFIGHGRSPDWMELKLFIQDRLHLTCVDFNSEPVAGLTNKERLLAMLDESCFAFLVMTGEDEQGDGTRRARENVIHEVGLFQGRLSFERAIVLLEETCSMFSNMDGLTQLRYPSGMISAKFEDVRSVLTREGILK